LLRATRAAVEQLRTSSAFSLHDATLQTGSPNAVPYDTG
jgi:hypothetical protein